MNALQSLGKFGQSVWLDSIDRQLLESGKLRQMIEEDGLGGLTSNPAIFEKAISGGKEYAPIIARLRTQGIREPLEIYEAVAVADIQEACRELEIVYRRTKSVDGYVSLEVSPHLARDTEGTLKEARRLWNTVKKPNLMIKVPGTADGVPAIRQLISEGISVNVTLLFSQEAYEAVAWAYLEGLEALARNGGDVSKPSSVASFFISRIDSLIDSIVSEKLAASENASERALLKHIQGKVAIANAKQAYQRYKKIFSGSRWEALAAKGAKPQRLLWASTSTKNPAYRDVIYIEELVGANTVNTVPPATLDAFRDHGRARAAIEENVNEANEIMATLPRVGISMKDVTDKLLTDAVRLFVEPFDKLLAAIAKA